MGSDAGQAGLSGPAGVIGVRSASGVGRVFGYLLLLLVPAGLLAWGADQLMVWINRSETVRPWLELVGLGRYNTRIVVLAAGLLGLAGGVAGTFLLLRKRSLVTDALAHAMLPGVVGAFMISVLFFGGGAARSMGVLMFGAVVAALLGMGFIMLIRDQTRLKEDAALGIVLSVFYGGGVVLLSMAQRLPESGVAGLEGLLLGRAASLRMEDLRMVAMVAAVVVWLTAVLFKEFMLLCFDRGFAASAGMSVTWLDVLMMSLVIAVTVVGLKAVGLILVIALLIIPPASARFWTDRLGVMTLASAVLGLVSGVIGVTLSSRYADLPTGPVIVLCAGSLFLASVVLGPRRGLIPVAWRHQRLKQTIGIQNLLRALYEQMESKCEPAQTTLDRPVADSRLSRKSLMKRRSWSHGQLRRLVRTAELRGWVRLNGDGSVVLTAGGRSEAAQLTRRHRLWEMYLITHADIAPSHVDRDADQIEHILGAEMVDELEQLLDAGRAAIPVPDSPHDQASEPVSDAESGKGGAL